MSMPQFPPQPYRPDLHQTIIDLLDSIALEEVALSHVLNAEAEKIQQFIRHISSCTPTDILIDFNIVVNETLETVLMKEWLLLRKLENVTRFANKQFPPPCPPVCPPQPIPVCPPTPACPPIPACPQVPTCPQVPVCQPQVIFKVSKPRRAHKKHRKFLEE